MSIRHPKLLAWEKTLKRVLDMIDGELESRFGEYYPLHPVRAEHGHTANPAHDGLFGLGASFSAGYGSKHGPGYVVRLRLSTLSHVPKDIITQMEARVIERLEEELPKAFPNRELRVSRDGAVFKIHGDLGLGNA